MKQRVKLTVNGVAYEAEIEPRTLLVDSIRGKLGLTGTHIGCLTGKCGACTVIYNGMAVKSCMMLTVQADSGNILTVEGLASEGLHPLQKAFWENHALQCGFCTPGMLMSTKALLDEKPNPTSQEIRKAISGNLCRCTGYMNIVNAIKVASKQIHRSGGS